MKIQKKSVIYISVLSKVITTQSKNVINTYKLITYIILTYKYIGYNIREKVIVVFTDKLNLSVQDETELVKFLYKIEKQKINFNLTIIGLSCDKESISNIIKLLDQFKIANFVKIEEIGLLRRKLMIRGNVNPEIMFTNEKLEKIKR